MIALAPETQGMNRTALAATVELIDAALKESERIHSDDVAVGWALYDLGAVRRALVAVEGRQ